MHDTLTILQEAAERFIRPRFQALQDGDISEKSPGELVTVADRKAEIWISRKLQLIRPDLPVVGEEAVADDASLMQAVIQGESCWLLDPLDGTRNFIDGDPHYGVALALVEAGTVTEAWVWQPEFSVAWHARRGEGTTRNGGAMRTTPGTGSVEQLRGILHLGKFPAEDRARYESLPVRYLVERGHLNSASDYPLIIEGAIDFLGWARILPWDHLPGALLLEEAGGTVRRLNGEPYTPQSQGFGLLAARTSDIWDTMYREFSQQ